MSTVEKPSLAVADYDPWNCAVNDNPFPYYAALRREAPVHHVVNRGMWVISRHDDVQRALADTEAFSSSFVYVGKPIAVPTIEELERDWLTTDSEGTPAPADLDRVPVDPSLVDPDETTPLLASLAESDPPDHTRIRKLLTRTPRWPCSGSSPRTHSGCSPWSPHCAERNRARTSRTRSTSATGTPPG
jgi:cytochrome P450